MYEFAKKAADREGFTLVELIVVIAILGILAGIAIPIYSGYIKKANEAADNTLLAAVNTAFAAACVQVDPENGLPDTASAEIGSDGILTRVSPYGETEADPFWTFFGTNKDTPFKAYKTLNYSKEKGFYGNGSGSGDGDGSTHLSNGWTLTVSDDGTTTTYTVTKDDGTELVYTASNEDIANVTSSTFGNGDMSMGTLTGNVDTVVKAARSAINDDYLKTILGNDYLNDLGLATGATHDQLANALVMMVAGRTDQSIMNEIKAKAQSGEFTLNMSDVMSDMGGAITKTAAMYGLITGFAYSEYGSALMQVDMDGDGTSESMSVKAYYEAASLGLQNAVDGTDGLGIVTELMNNIMADGRMAQYLSTGQADKDLEGYLSTMNVLTGNRDTLVSGNEVLNTGFADDDMLAILDGIFPSQP